MKNIFEYENYRPYLIDWLNQAKQQKTSNLSRLAQVAQVHATFLSQVLSGGKELSLEQAALISLHLQHTKLEREYFFTLIQLGRAGNTALVEHWREKKKELEADKNRLSQRFEKHRSLTSEQRAVFYSSWLYSAVRIFTSIGHGATVSDVADRFQITRDKAEQILSFLAQTGLCAEKAGHYSIGDSHVHVPNESPFVVKHHTNWRIRAIQEMDRREAEELFFTAPMSVAKKDFAVIREKINKLIVESINLAKESNAEDLFCLNIDFFRSK